ncbi:deaminase [Opitutaceae bacterium EW11]|nr:deaminase [Opitutaceae bacterium EW11]
MTTPQRPRVILQMAASLDGRIAFGPGLTMFDQHPAAKLLPDQGPLWKEVRDAIDAEWHPQATMMGSRTVLREGAELKELPAYADSRDTLLQDFLPDDVVQATRHWAVLVDGRGRCRSGYKATETLGWHVLHLVSRSAPSEHLAFLREKRIPYLVGGERHADLAGALAKMAGQLGVKSMVLWGGGTLNGAMLRQRLVDEIHLIVQPVAIGGRTTPTLFDCDDLREGESPALVRLISARPAAGGYLWLHYTVQ